ncbi:MAG: calcium/sodium antiporter [Proteobacteria bacterium]|nr:calcium/sodium antiporter [Pseudomonadota bacterium]MDA1043011.1 calcium/sodium antiporter [Pseudomonadota bacterium]
MEWLLVGSGLVVLLGSGDCLVRGAVNLALRLGVAPLIVGLTIVGFGTSAPELLVSINAALDGVPGIAMGNVVGSNTANILLILGLPAVIVTLHTSTYDTKKPYVIMIAASLLFIALASFGEFGRLSGLVLLSALATFMIYTIKNTLQERKATAKINAEKAEFGDLPEGADPSMAKWKIAIFLVIGLLGLPFGAELLVANATVIAKTHGVSDTVIGLTLVALGTSLPELATTLMSALRRQADVALGNVIGSNIFNLLGILGIASLVAPIPVDAQFLRFDLWVMLGASLLLLPFVFFKKDITRRWGFGLTALYLAYMAFILI